MIVVSNTSPLTNLAAIGHLDLLNRLYERVHIADGVWQELNFEGKRWPGSLEVEQADWIERHSVKGRALVEALATERFSTRVRPRRRERGTSRELTAQGE